MPLTRHCPFRTCGKLIPDDKFACYPHWISLTQPQKAKIWEAYNAYTSNAIDGEELRRLQQIVLDEADPPKPRHINAPALPDTKPPCRSCRRPIIWARTVPGGKLIPLDPDPAEHGNIRLLDNSECEVLTAIEAAAEREAGKGLYRSHFATCPNASDHRKRGEPKRSR